MRIVGFEVIPRSIPSGLTCKHELGSTNAEILEEHGGQEVSAEMPIKFSYSLHVKHSAQTWATRLDHYMNYGSAVLDWESFGLSAAVVYCTTFCVWCILSSMLNKDYQILTTLR